MSRKDFILIADTIFHLDLYPLSDETVGMPRTVARRRIAEAFADMLAETNDQFKRDLFIQAATGVVAPNARKAVRVA